jgi:hypothetical protein
MHSEKFLVAVGRVHLPLCVGGALNAAVAGALADTGTRQRLADLGLEIAPPEQQAPEALGTYHKAEIETTMVIIALVWIGMTNTGTMSNYAPTTALISR